jgi:AraC family transcriptional regulator of adaptative response/methylated-DNA-[protein]-cysteine methyltransferase
MSTPQQLRFGASHCSLGAILVAATKHGVCAISLGDDPAELIHELQQRFAPAELIGGDAELERWLAVVVELVESPQLGSTLPLDIQGTAFQQRVWGALREIPPGTTTTYTELAHQLRQPRAIRAVASACAANALAVVVPCHRVVRLDGGLAGYRWGMERKRALLARESGRT